MELMAKPADNMVRAVVSQYYVVVVAIFPEATYYVDHTAPFSHTDPFSHTALTATQPLIATQPLSAILPL